MGVMMTTNVLEGCDTKLLNTVMHAFKECDAPTQKDVLELLEIMADENSSEDEKNHAAITFKHILWPQGAYDLASLDGLDNEGKQIAADFEREEALFSENLAKIMAVKKVNQSELAKKIGVGQPAIANLLARKCRPQRRTVVKISEALGINPKELWPALK